MCTSPGSRRRQRSGRASPSSRSKRSSRRVRRPDRGQDHTLVPSPVARAIASAVKVLFAPVKHAEPPGRVVLPAEVQGRAVEVSHPAVVEDPGGVPVAPDAGHDGVLSPQVEEVGGQLIVEEQDDRLARRLRCQVLGQPGPAGGIRPVGDRVVGDEVDRSPVEGVARGAEHPAVRLGRVCLEVVVVPGEREGGHRERVEHPAAGEKLRLLPVVGEVACHGEEGRPRAPAKNRLQVRHERLFRPQEAGISDVEVGDLDERELVHDRAPGRGRGETQRVRPRPGSRQWGPSGSTTDRRPGIPWASSPSQSSRRA